MRGCKNITNISTLNGIEYESYLRFKATLPDTTTAHELLQIRWIMTHASYLDSGASIFIACNNPDCVELITQSIQFVDKNITLNFASHDLVDMAVIFDNLSISELENIFKRVKPNGYMILKGESELVAEIVDMEVCDLKIYRKPVQKEELDFNIHIFIPIHNGITQTLRCLQSVYKQTVIDVLNITIIDDGSSDGSAQTIKENFPEVKIVAGDGSLWWSGSINKALQFSQCSFKDKDYFLLINNDVVLNPNTVFSLIKEAVKDRSLCLAPLGFTEDESIACGEAQDGHIFYRFEHSSKAMLQASNLYSVLSLFGRCTLYPVEILNKVDSFDSVIFPHYWGDTDFCLRAKEFGYNFKISGKTSIMVQHDTDTTGSHHDFFAKKRNLREVYHYLTDIKSLGNIKYIWRFYSRHHPKQKYNVVINEVRKALKQVL